MSFWLLHDTLINIQIIQLVSLQVRVMGTVTEMSDSEIAEFYKDEPLWGKIRSKICRCGEKVDWDELKTRHDQVLHDYLDRKETLPRLDT